jgi:shikimate dehydrogenase
MSDKYAVFGNPIAHSRSPQIHVAFAAQTGDDIDYIRVLVPAGQFNETARQFISCGGKGLNITLPCKVDAYQFADNLTQRAQRANAVNTLLVKPDGSLLGDNTDGEGLVSDILNNLDFPILDQRILLLGAGGAVRGVLEPLLAQAPQVLVLANRTAAKAQVLAAQFSDLGSVTGGAYDQIPADMPFDLIINGTSASLENQMPPLSGVLLSANCCCYDMMYGPRPTVFMEWARAQKVDLVSDGLGMLVEQAACSFKLWRGNAPATGPVISTIRSELSAR